MIIRQVAAEMAIMNVANNVLPCMTMLLQQQHCYHVAVITQQAVKACMSTIVNMVFLSLQFFPVMNNLVALSLLTILLKQGRTMLLL